jgi:UDP-4-amino-4,6-dideoxy-N-acetyl-beta-L-altrosamine transaminase
MRSYIPYGKQWIDEDDINAVIATLKSDYLTQGPAIEEFESKICCLTGADYCVAVSSATAGLHIAIAALNIESGMEGITSPNTFVATSNAMIYNGLKPVFADIDRRTYNVDINCIKEKITDKTRVLIPVHFAGQPCDMKLIREFSKDHQLYVIEDAAHAIGSRYESGKSVGSCDNSDMTVFSFHPVKTIATGEGGAITTNDEKLYNKLKFLRSHGITRNIELLSQNPGPWYYEMQELGYNYRMTDLQASLGSSQLNKLERFVKRRREIVEKYNEAFSKIECLTIPFESKEVFSAFHLYVLLVDFDKLGITRRDLMGKLSEKKIGSQVHYIPVHTQPFYQNQYGYRVGDYPSLKIIIKKHSVSPYIPG